MRYEPIDIVAEENAIFLIQIDGPETEDEDVHQILVDVRDVDELIAGLLRAKGECMAWVAKNKGLTDAKP